MSPVPCPLSPIPCTLHSSPRRAVYYNKQAVANYTVHYLNALLGTDEQTKSILSRTFQMPGASGNYIEMAWKDACGVPQRGS